MKTETLQIDQRQASLRDIGSGPPLLLVHGFPLDSTLWSEQWEALSSNFRVLCPDLPGFGASQAVVDSEYQVQASMTFLADWLAKLIDQVVPGQPVHYCGLSMGGYIGWEFGRRHGDRVRSMIACNTRAAADDAKVRRGRELAAREVLRDGAEPLARRMVQRLFLSPDQVPENHRQRMQACRQQTMSVMAQTDPAAIAAGQRAMGQRADFSQLLGDWSIPLLMVAGQEDPITTPESMLAEAQRVPGARYECIPDSAHLTPLENPEPWNQLVTEFLLAVD